jgi:molybdopterin-guanine dinucleotide biosynthesis protein MobB
MTAPPIVSIVGKSKSGKTTLIEKLIPEIRQRGYRVGTVKHHFHTDKSLDIPGKDTYRHAMAGAERVVLISPLTTVTFDYPTQPPTPHQIAQHMIDFDLILAEGFSQAGLPAIEVLRAARHTEPMDHLLQRIAIAADFSFPDFNPVFDLNAITELADFIEQRYLLEQ